MSPITAFCLGLILGPFLWAWFKKAIGWGENG